jgi:DMSO reductase anchor subunit
MHPAYSVILFTAASGAGYGLLSLLAIFAISGLLPATTWLGFFAIGLAVALIVGGLISSTLHLGRPERAMRALTQWRSSWLAREGVAAILAFVPIAIFGVGWVFYNTTSGFFAAMGAASAVMALITVSCTAMIYASLKPIRQWRSALVLPGYLVYGLMTGALLLVLLSLAFNVYQPVFAGLALALLGLGWIVKTAYWSSIDRQRPQSTLETATGLGAGGPVRLLEMPHTEENFLMQEMGYQIARDHSARLRAITHVALFLAPIALIALIAAGFVPMGLAVLLALVAVLSAGVGILTERWLFFAEARHSSMLYYGRPA